MAEFELTFIDERPELSVTTENYELSASIPGIQGAQGPAGVNNVVVSDTEPADPFLHMIWVRPV